MLNRCTIINGTVLRSRKPSRLFIRCCIFPKNLHAWVRGVWGVRGVNSATAIQPRFSFSQDTALRREYWVQAVPGNLAVSEGQKRNLKKFRLASQWIRDGFSACFVSANVLFTDFRSHSRIFQRAINAADNLAIE